MVFLPYSVIPAKAGIQKPPFRREPEQEKACGFYDWIPASAGMTPSLGFLIVRRIIKRRGEVL